jgi:tetratricopeptide (TPR) repeat protein
MGEEGASRKRREPGRITARVARTLGAARRPYWIARWILIASLLGTMMAGRAHAQTGDGVTGEPSGYRTLVEEAVLEFSERNYEESRALFARAHALYPNARTLRGLGFAEFELRNYVECIQQLEAALRSPVRALEGELRDEAERLLARARNFVGRLAIEVRPAGARLTLDGNHVTLAPGAALTLPVGVHTLEAQAPGFLAERRQLRVTGGEQQLVSLVLLAQSAETSASPRDDSAPKKRWYKSPWLWGTLGVVAAGAAATALVLTQGGGTVREEPNGGSASAVLVGPSQ